MMRATSRYFSMCAFLLLAQAAAAEVAPPPLRAAVLVAKSLCMANVPNVEAVEKMATDQRWPVLTPTNADPAWFDSSGRFKSGGKGWLFSVQGITLLVTILNKSSETQVSGFCAVHFTGATDSEVTALLVSNLGGDSGEPTIEQSPVDPSYKVSAREWSGMMGDRMIIVRYTQPTGHNNSRSVSRMIGVLGVRH